MDSLRVGNPARSGIQIPGTLDEGACYESILTKGFESILYDLLCRQPDTKTCSAGSRKHMFHHSELRYGTMGLIDFSFSAATEREIITVCATSARFTTLSPKRTWKSIKRRPTCSVTKTSSLSRRAFPCRGSFGRRAQGPPIKVKLCITPSFFWLS